MHFFISNSIFLIIFPKLFRFKRYTTAGVKIYKYPCFYIKSIPKVSHYNIYFFTYAHPRYMKYLFTNIQKQWNVNIRKLHTSRANNYTILRIKNAKGCYFRVLFLHEPEQSEIFKSVLEYL